MCCLLYVLSSMFVMIPLMGKWCFDWESPFPPDWTWGWLLVYVIFLPVILMMLVSGAVLVLLGELWSLLDKPIRS